MITKIYYSLLFCFFSCYSIRAQDYSHHVVTDDINHFWQAYDKIVSTDDSVRQYAYLNELFTSKGTPGLQAIMQLKGYTAKSYIDAIHKYPLFWKSIRGNMNQAGAYAGRIGEAVRKLAVLYPGLRPAKIYFTVGAFKTGGTTQDSLVLIGSEISMADRQTETTEIAGDMAALAGYMKSDPLSIIVFTNVHEYVHTQQKITAANTLLGQCLLEGVAEFVAEKVMGKGSTIPAIAYGRGHAAEVKAVFSRQLFNGRYGYWLYNNEVNPFGNRDMGYYTGYAICEAYYQQAKDKQAAIRDMIQLNYNDEEALAAFADCSHYFDMPLAAMRKGYEDGRPSVAEVFPLKDSAVRIDASLSRITIRFSAPMDKRYRNFQFGPLGEANGIKIKRVEGFDEAGTSLTLEVVLSPGRQYQLVVGDGFRSVEGRALKPYLIEFWTAAEK